MLHHPGEAIEIGHHFDVDSLVEREQSSLVGQEQLRTADPIEIETRDHRVVPGEFCLGLQRRCQLIEVPVMASLVLEEQIDHVLQRLRLGHFRDWSDRP